MKQKFSPKWKASKQVRKQRKYRANAPLHIKYKMLAAHVSKELRQKYKRRAVVAIKNDTAKVMRGFFKGKQGKISEVNTNKGFVYIEGVQRTRKDGTKVNVSLKPSNLMIINLNLEDKRRVASLEKRKKGEK